MLEFSEISPELFATIIQCCSIIKDSKNLRIDAHLHN